MTRPAVTSQPNLKNTIKCVSLAIYYHIKNRKSNVILEIFDEKSHPLTVSNKPILSYYIIRVTLNTELDTLSLNAVNSYTSHLNIMIGTCPESWTSDQENKVYSMFKMPFRRKSWLAKTFIFFQNFSSDSVYRNDHLKTSNLMEKAKVPLVSCSSLFLTRALPCHNFTKEVADLVVTV